MKPITRKKIGAQLFREAIARGMDGEPQSKLPAIDASTYSDEEIMEAQKPATGPDSPSS